MPYLGDNGARPMDDQQVEHHSPASEAEKDISQPGISNLLIHPLAASSQSEGVACGKDEHKATVMPVPLLGKGKSNAQERKAIHFESELRWEAKQYATSSVYTLELVITERSKISTHVSGACRSNEAENMPKGENNDSRELTGDPAASCLGVDQRRWAAI
ncbi:hypothetical protein O1611_g3840 [Lasiodiplodia mahajangana]|uniref:Uncharacterized protein n=1 Tax=Lasiodiplodia mahajangana TaxID=1108764 RepID=A0ACC2JQN4_9PEZI|nr:hypothetical protein O1611_g3840 [Lasiodiplodia mahajangana]